MSIMLCLTAVTWTMTSCFNDDDGNTISEQQMKKCIADMAGNYSGKLITGVIQNNTLTETDTLDNQTWTAGDSKLTFMLFPASQLAKSITDSDIKAAVAASEEMISIEAYYYSFSSVSSTYQFTLAPQTVSISVNYNGGTHELKFPFYQGGYSYGLGNATTQSLQLVVGGMFVDGQQSNFFTEMALEYAGKKG